MRLRLPSLAGAVLAVSLVLTVAGPVAGASGNPSEVLSIEGAQGTFQIRGRGYLNMRVQQGSVLIVDQSPLDRFSPFIGGVPRGKTSSASGKDINVYVLGGRYKMSVRGSGINISARGDGVVLLSGDPDTTGSAGTIRIGDVVRSIPAGESKAAFGGSSSVEGSPGAGADAGRGGGRS